jgi:hypothetical protein
MSELSLGYAFAPSSRRKRRAHQGWGSGLAEVSGLFHPKISVTFEQLRPSNRPMGCGCSWYRAFKWSRGELTARVRANP